MEADSLLRRPYTRADCRVISMIPLSIWRVKLRSFLPSDHSPSAVSVRNLTVYDASYWSPMRLTVMGV